MCIGCRGREPQAALVRLVAGMRDGVLVASPEGKLPADVEPLGGRGAYLHDAPECARTALKTRALQRSFRIPARIQAELASYGEAGPKSGRAVTGETGYM